MLELSNLPPPALYRDAVMTNPDFDRIDEVGEGSLAEQDDVSSRPAGVVNILDVGVVGGDDDVAAGESQEPIAVATFGEIKSHSPLSTGPSLGRDSKAECRGERTNDIKERV
jgi:hypothetical protein